MSFAQIFRYTLMHMKPKLPQERDPVADQPQDTSSEWAPVFHSLGLPAYQIRVEDDTVSIVAPAPDCPKLLSPEIRQPLAKHGKSLGYRFITLDIGHLSKS